MFDALGLDVPRSAIERAAGACSPEAMSAQFGAGFVSSPLGRSDPLTPGERARIERAFAPEIERYGLGA